MQTLVEIGPSNASQWQYRRKDATEPMKNLTLASTPTQVHGFSSADVLPMKLLTKDVAIYIYIYISLKAFYPEAILTN